MSETTRRAPVGRLRAWQAAASKLELADFYKEVWEKEHL